MVSNFGGWITQKYREWRDKQPIGHASSVAKFAAVFGASQPLMSQWMREGSKPPIRHEYVEALIREYGDEARQILGIEKTTKVEINIDQIPPELQSLLTAALADISSTFTAEGIDPESPGAYERSVEILGRHGFAVTRTENDNSGKA